MIKIGSWITLIIEAKTEYLRQILILLPVGITTTYDWEGYTTIICNPDYLGYAEPIEFYEKVKDFVKDIHYIDIACAVTRFGVNNQIKAYSCKKEYKEEQVK